MDAPGITGPAPEQDAATPAAPTTCPKCGSETRVGRGLCLSCLLHQGIAPDDEVEVREPDTKDGETLDKILAEVDVRAVSWRLGNYEILKEIGRGGMGVIYQARQRYSRRIVAVKRLLGYHADSRETLVRFRREAQAAASLDHPNILPIYDVSETEDGIPFFSMKLASGGSLAGAAASLRNQPRQCVALVAKVTRAVQYAHAHGILHRDLKPGNILLDEQGNPLVSDFGLAKWLNASSDLTHTLTIFGTPGYIAPEQSGDSNAPSSPAADIYSLGAILFDLLVGRPPFVGSHAVSVIRQAAEKEAPKLRSLCQLADRDLETICARCLEREAGARYQSAHDLAEDLERWLEGRPIIARPVSSPVRAWRWAKRNPKLAVAFAAIALLSVAGLTAAMMNSRLSSMVQRNEIAQHSIVIMPFEDLDAASATSDAAESANSDLATAFGSSQGIHTIFPSAPETARDPWSPEQWKRIGEAADARMVLSGSVRQREGKQHLALHLIETATGSVVRTWLTQGTQGTQGPAVAEPPTSNLPQTSQGLAASEPPTSNIRQTSQGTAASEPRTSNIPPSFLPSLSRLLDDPKPVAVTSIGDTTNTLAHSYYERGREFFFRYNVPDLERAIESYRKAIEIDPNYAQAHAALAVACQLRSSTDPTGDWLSEAAVAEAKALDLAPMLPEAHNARAGYFRARGFYREALDPSLTAYELDPSDARTAAKVASIYEVLGQLDLAMFWFNKAVRRETRPVYDDNIASVWATLGDYDKAEKAYQSAAVFRPDLPVSALGLSWVAIHRGDFELARQRCTPALAKYKDNPQPLMMAALIEFYDRRYSEAEKLYREAMKTDRTGSVEFAGSIRFLSALGFILRQAGAEEEGKKLLEEARQLDAQELWWASADPKRLYDLAANEAALGNSDAALTALTKSIEGGWVDYRSIELDPRFDSVRETPGLKGALDRLKQQIQSMRQRIGS